MAVLSAVSLALVSACGPSAPAAPPEPPAITQPPALPGAQPVSPNDRVYTADQDSNTVSVIDPKAGTVLGTIALGQPRMAPDADVLGAMYHGQIDVHGLGFSRDGQHLCVIDVTSNAVHVVDTATNQVLRTIYVGRAPHEGFFSPDGNQLWIAERGQDTVAVIDWRNNQVLDRIRTEDGPSKVVFSPDGRLAYVNHLRASALDVIDVASRRIVQRVALPAEAGGSSDEAISPDGKEIWLGMPNNGRTTTVVNTDTYRVQAVLDTGPRTNHPNFVTVDGVDYAYVTIGDLNQTLVYRRAPQGGQPELVKRIQNHGAGSHGIWPSPDNTRVYVGLQNSDSVDVIDTRRMEVIDTLRIGQSPMALVYVARSGPASTANLGRQGLDMRIEGLPVEVQATPGTGTAFIRALPGIDEITLNVRGLPPNRRFTLYGVRGQDSTTLLSATSNSTGGIPEALAFVAFFANNYEKVVLRPD
ncbi:beta-propeller fold lactonase family protein [Saccharopolyspora sp. K220]|uniref:YVTN family beta-propeller repeat protein n=1 Tax=Saccharopolyspora soli TaxID=2926618 RepID=UPI001F57BAF2|nr:beta-propeller fold lactonase family protein [Saccharopolyspora soli]MCI2419279.1 beta-propeller fold lactonase family protein [Saccharopolyspora soli]